MMKMMRRTFLYWPVLVNDHNHANLYYDEEGDDDYNHHIDNDDDERNLLILASTASTETPLPSVHHLQQSIDQSYDDDQSFDDNDEELKMLSKMRRRRTLR